MAEKIQNLINHIALVVDASGSMISLAEKVVEVFDAELQNLKKSSQDFKQETRISIYLLGTQDGESHSHAWDGTTCLVSDMDVMRFDSLNGHYTAHGNTPLISATTLAVKDMKMFPTKYGDHSFLVYVLTDGEENRSRDDDKRDFNKLLSGLPEDWTIACLVPNQLASRTAIQYGFPKECLGIWDVSEKGLKAQGDVLRTSLDTYMQARSLGVRGTKSFFAQVNTKDLTRDVVTKTLVEAKPELYKIVLNDTPKAVWIRDLVNDKIKPRKFVQGEAYYQLVKKETIQAAKKLAIQDNKNGKVYCGIDARSLLGIPSSNASVAPGDFGMWTIFVQSTSVNRNVIPNQKVLVFI